MLGQFARQDQSHGRLDFSARHRGFFVVPRQFRGFRRDLFEDVVDERVHDAHRLAGNPGVRMDLLQDFVDVNLVRFDLLFRGLLGAAFDGLLRWFLAGHFCVLVCVCVCLLMASCWKEWSRNERSNFALVWVCVGFSRFRTIKFLLLKKSRIEWIAASRVLNQWARKVSRVIRSVVIRPM